MQPSPTNTSLSHPHGNSSTIAAPAGPLLRVGLIGICLLTLLLLLSISIVEILGAQRYGITLAGENGDYLIALAFGLLAIVGALAAMGQPRNAVGWILLLDGLAVGLASFSIVWEQVATAWQLGERSMVLGQWAGSLGWLTGLALLIVIFPFLFPDGRLPAGRIWRPVFLVACAMVIILVVIHLVALPLIWAGDLTAAARMEQALGQLLIAYFPLGFAALVSLAVRYRQANDHTRRQLKWLLLTFGATIVAFLILALLEDYGGLTFSNIVYGPLYLMIPVGLGIALLQYQLWDVDHVIRKTAQYAIVTGLLILLYLGMILVLQGLFADFTGQDSPVVIVLSTLAIAALFNPLRHRVQALIDRRFYRSKYNAEQILERFATSVRDETDLDALTAELVQVIQDTMQPEFVSVWLRPLTEATTADETASSPV